MYDDSRKWEETWNLIIFLAHKVADKSLFRKDIVDILSEGECKPNKSYYAVLVSLEELESSCRLTGWNSNVSTFLTAKRHNLSSNCEHI